MAYNNLVQSVLRALDIVLEIGDGRAEPTLRDLSARLNLKAPTTHNLLRSLKARGFVRQYPGQARYGLGPAIFDLIARHYESRLLIEAEATVRSLFSEMQRKVTVLFTEQMSGSLQTLLRMSPDQPAVMQKPCRMILDPYISATALVGHAFGSEEDLQAFQERYPFQECAGMFADAPRKFAAALKQIRRQEYALRPDSYRDQVAMAAPVLSVDGELLGIIGLSRVVVAAATAREAAKKNMLTRLLAAAGHMSKRWQTAAGNTSVKIRRKATRRGNFP